MLTPTLTNAFGGSSAPCRQPKEDAPIDHIYGANLTWASARVEKSTQAQKISDHPLVVATTAGSSARSPESLASRRSMAMSSTSTTDNQRFGSGNKVLHNVVGGNIGVFEGNGGDLRIGLARQSLHDGQRWLHRPLRLSVIITAPRSMIEQVIASHQVVRELVEHAWLYLLRLDDDRAASLQIRDASGWRAVLGD
mgnify:CR=1 FL=1